MADKSSATVQDTMNGKNSWVPAKELDRSKPLVNKDSRGGADINSGTGQVFVGSPNDAKKDAPRVTGGGKKK